MKSFSSGFGSFCDGSEVRIIDGDSDFFFGVFGFDSKLAFTRVAESGFSELFSAFGLFERWWRSRLGRKKLEKVDDVFCKGEQMRGSGLFRIFWQLWTSWKNWG